MKLSSSFILLPVTLAALSSCGKTLNAEYPSAEAAIQVKPVASVLSKAPLAGTTLPTDRTIVLSAYHNAPLGGTSQNYFSGSAFRYSDGAWKENKWWPSGGTLDIFAYSADGLEVSAAYATNVGEGVTLTVPDNSSIQTDILWGYKAGATSAGGAVALDMRHAEAALAFTAKSAAYDAANNTGITITAITVNNVNCAGKVALGNSEACSWSSLSTAKDLVLPGLSEGYDVPGTAMTIDGSAPFGIGGTGLIVIPQAATSVTITYTAHNGRSAGGDAIDAIGQTADITLSGDWVAGKKYVYNLEFADGVSVSASVYEWTTEGGSVPVKKTVTATYSVSAETEVELPVATLSAGAIVSIDWGDGLCETYQTSSSLNKIFSHTYASEYSGTVSFIVHIGTVDFGEVNSDVFRKFSVNDDEKFLIAENTFDVDSPFGGDEEGI